MDECADVRLGLFLSTTIEQRTRVCIHFAMMDECADVRFGSFQHAHLRTHREQVKHVFVSYLEEHITRPAVVRISKAKSALVCAHLTVPSRAVRISKRVGEREHHHTDTNIPN